MHVYFNSVSATQDLSLLLSWIIEHLELHASHLLYYYCCLLFVCTISHSVEYTVVFIDVLV